MSLPMVALAGCAMLPSSQEEPELLVPEQCRNIHVDRLDIDWLAVRGNTADPKVRLRVEKSGDGYRAWYIDGSFVRRELEGVKRDKDVRFTEVPDDAKRARVESGQEELVRMYIEPVLTACALKAYVGRVDKSGAEKIPPTGTELVPFPKQQGVNFSFAVADEPLFLAEAASNLKVRDKQLGEGGPKVDVEMGTVAVGTWSKVEEDGDPSCAYDMDLYFDDQLDVELSPRAAAEPVDGVRHWFVDWDAPFSGNHHFEMFRYRTCGDGKRELIAVAGVDAILM